MLILTAVEEAAGNGRGATDCSGVTGLLELSSEVLLEDVSMLVQLLEELAG